MRRTWTDELDTIALRLLAFLGGLRRRHHQLRAIRVSSRELLAPDRGRLPFVRVSRGDGEPEGWAT